MQLSSIQLNPQCKHMPYDFKRGNNPIITICSDKTCTDSVSFSGNGADDFLNNFEAANISTRDEIQDYVHNFSRMGLVKGSTYAGILDSLRPKIQELCSLEAALEKRESDVDCIYDAIPKILGKEILNKHGKAFNEDMYQGPSIQITAVTKLLMDNRSKLIDSNSSLAGDLLPYLRDEKGEISSRYLNFLQRVFDIRSSLSAKFLPDIINSVKDKKGNYSPEKAAAFIGCCRMRSVSVDEALQFMKLLYPAENSSNVQDTSRALFKNFEDESQKSAKFTALSFVSASKLVNLLEQITKKEQSLKLKDEKLKDDISKISSYRDDIKDKVLADVRILNGISVPKKDKYVSCGEQMSVVGDFVNNLPNVAGKFLLSFSLADLVLSMRDSDGSISSKSLEFLNKFVDVRKPSVTDLMRLPSVFYAIKDENGNFSAEMSNAFISAYSWPEATLESAFDFMRKTYGVDFEKINQKLSPQYRSEIVKKLEDLHKMQTLIDALDKRTFPSGSKRFGLSIDNDGYLVIDNTRNEYCLQPNWFPELNSNDAFRYISKVIGGLELLNKESRVTDIGALKETTDKLLYNKDDNIVGIDQVKTKDRIVR